MLKMTENVPGAAVQTITYKRQAHKRKRADLLAALPAEEVHQRDLFAHLKAFVLKTCHNASVLSKLLVHGGA